MKLVLRTIATAVAVAVAAYLVPGIVVSGPTASAKLLTLLAVAVVIGLLNALVKPIVQGLTGCLILLTFGLFLLVINAGMLMLASLIAQNLGFGFSVVGFMPAVIGSIIISIVSGVMNGVLGTHRQD